MSHPPKYNITFNIGNELQLQGRQGDPTRLLNDQHRSFQNPAQNPNRRAPRLRHLPHPFLLHAQSTPLPMQIKFCQDTIN